MIIKKIFIAIIPMTVLYSVNFVFTFIFEIYDNVYASVIMHTLGGMVTAWALLNIYHIFQIKYKFKVETRFLFILFIMGGVAIIGILWEVHEIILDYIFPQDFGLTNTDTVTDLVMDTLGAWLFMSFYSLIKLKRTKLDKKGKI